MICFSWHFIKSLAGLTRHGMHRACLPLALTCEMVMWRGASQLVLWESLRWGRWRGRRRAVIMHFLWSVGRPPGALVIPSAAWLWTLRGLQARGYLPSVPRVGHLLFHSRVGIICNFFNQRLTANQPDRTPVWTRIEKRLVATRSSGTMWGSGSH